MFEKKITLEDILNIEIGSEAAVQSISDTAPMGVKGDRMLNEYPKGIKGARILSEYPKGTKGARILSEYPQGVKAPGILKQD